jgi:hypothetical protein
VNDRCCQELAPLAVWPCNAGVRSRPAWLPYWAFAAWRSRLSRRCRPDTERLSCRSLWLGPEERPAARRELGFVSDHADGDAVDIRDFGTAQAKRVVAAGLLLLGCIGLAWRGPHRNRERGRQHQAKLNIPGPDPKHESPPTLLLRIVGEWRGNGKANRTAGHNMPGEKQQSLRLERPEYWLGEPCRSGFFPIQPRRVNLPTLPE